MSEISAIDTRYNGYRFRSRLEARWAIFFDQMGAPYLYEPEGFELGDLKYLPDFYLCEGVRVYGENDRLSNLWVEVKHSLALETEDKQKIARFVQQTDNVLLILSGDPEPSAKLRLIAHKANSGAWLTPLVSWIELGDKELGLLNLDSLDSINEPDMRLAVERLEMTSRLTAAYAAARDARFEHGETPASQPFKYEIICATCGKRFAPVQPHHQHCYSCYLAERAKEGANLSNARNAPTSPSISMVSPSNSKWIYRLGALFLVLLVIMAGFVFVNQSRDDVIKETPNTAVEEASEPTGDEPASAPVRSIDIETEATCACTENLYDCADFETHAAAQACFDICYPQNGDVHYLDANSDGEACERLP